MKNPDYSPFFAFICFCLMVIALAQCEQAKDISDMKHEIELIRIKL